MDPKDEHAFGDTQRAAKMLAQQWMRAEALIRTYYPTDVSGLAKTRGVPWDTEVTGKWLMEDSALSKADRWPADDDLCRVAQNIHIFTTAIESLVVRIDPCTVANVTGGSMVDHDGLASLLEYVGMACDPSTEAGESAGSKISSAERPTWAEVLDLSEKRHKRFRRNVRWSETVTARAQKLVDEIEKAPHTFFFSDLIRNEMAAGHDEDEARLIVMEAITLSRAVVTGEPEMLSYLTSVQTARRTKMGIVGSVLVDDCIGGRRLAEFTPWVTVLRDGTVAVLGPDGTWAVKWHEHMLTMGNWLTTYAPLTDVQTEELRRSPRARWWPTELRMVSKFDLSALISLGELSSTMSDVLKQFQKEADEEYVGGRNEFSKEMRDAAGRALEMIHEQHPAAWETFVSRNITTRTMVNMYQSTSSASEFVSKMTERLVVGVSGFSLDISSDKGGKIVHVQATGKINERGVWLVRAGKDRGSGLSLPEVTEALGASEEQRRWVYAGLRMISRRFEEVVGGNCVETLLDDAEYKRYRHLMPRFVNTIVVSMANSDVHKNDWREAFAQKRAAIERGRKEKEAGAEKAASSASGGGAVEVS